MATPPREAVLCRHVGLVLKLYQVGRDEWRVVLWLFAHCFFLNRAAWRPPPFWKPCHPESTRLLDSQALRVVGSWCHMHAASHQAAMALCLAARCHPGLPAGTSSSAYSSLCLRSGHSTIRRLLSHPVCLHVLHSSAWPSLAHRSHRGMQAALSAPFPPGTGCCLGPWSTIAPRHEAAAVAVKLLCSSATSMHL